MTTRSTDTSAQRPHFRVVLLSLVLPVALFAFPPAAVVDAQDERAVVDAQDERTVVDAQDERTVVDAQDDLAAKSDLLQSPRWRRAIFELGEWLSTQKIYSPQEVQRIKAGFNDKVMRMSSRELEYLLDDLEAKFKVMDTPEAREARAWVGQYLSAMSDRKRAEVLKDVPNVVEMSAGQLALELQKIEQTRGALRERQTRFDEGRSELASAAEANRQATAKAAAAAASQISASPSYSPYRSGSGGGSQGSPPFSNSHVGSGMSIGVGPWGAYVGFSLGNF